MRRLLQGTEILRKIMLRRVAGITPVVLMVPDAISSFRCQPKRLLSHSSETKDLEREILAA